LGRCALPFGCLKEPRLTTCFVAWSQLWIYKAREELIRLRAATDYHANSVVRGYGPLMNPDAFHQAFGARPGDAMWRKPADRVRIW
jgi:putative endopeptidase